MLLVVRTVGSATVLDRNSVGAEQDDWAAGSSFLHTVVVADAAAVAAVVLFVPQAVAVEETVSKRAVPAEGSLRIELVVVQHFDLAASFAMWIVVLGFETVQVGNTTAALSEFGKTESEHHSFGDSSLEIGLMKDFLDAVAVAVA